MHLPTLATLAQSFPSFFSFLFVQSFFLQARTKTGYLTVLVAELLVLLVVPVLLL